MQACYGGNYEDAAGLRQHYNTTNIDSSVKGCKRPSAAWRSFASCNFMAPYKSHCHTIITLNCSETWRVKIENKTALHWAEMRMIRWISCGVKVTDWFSHTELRDRLTTPSLRHTSQLVRSVSWSLTSLFSTNMAISETKTCQSMRC